MCYIANPRSAAICDEHCSLHGGVCDNGVCEFRCSDYAGYTCQNSSSLLPSLSLCGDVLVRDVFGQHCAPSEPSILQQLEAAVVVPNYNRLMPGGRSLFSIFDNSYCSTAAKRLACWVCYLCLTILQFLLLLYWFFSNLACTSANSHKLSLTFCICVFLNCCRFLDFILIMHLAFMMCLIKWPT